MGMIRSNASNWDSYVGEMCNIQSHNRIWNVIRKLCFAATVYHIWRERNSIIFSDCRSNDETLVSLICEDVRAKLMSVKVKVTANILNAENAWDVKFDRRS